MQRNPSDILVKRYRVSERDSIGFWPLILHKLYLKNRVIIKENLQILLVARNMVKHRKQFDQQMVSFVSSTHRQEGAGRASRPPEAPALPLFKGKPSVTKLILESALRKIQHMTPSLGVCRIIIRVDVLLD